MVATTADIKVTARWDGKDLERGTKQAKQDMDRFQKSTDMAGKAMRTLGAAFGVAIGIEAVRRLGAAAVEMNRLASQTQAAARAFESMARRGGVHAPTLLREIDQAAAGTLSRFKQLQIANIALSSGIQGLSGNMGSLIKDIRTVSTGLGRVASEDIERVISAINKQEQELLDELGIVARVETAYKKYGASIGVAASKLDDLQKREAFASLVTDELRKKALAMGGVVNESAEAIGRMEAAWRNFQDTLGESVAIAGAVSQITSLIESLDELAQNIKSGKYDYSREIDAFVSGALGVPATQFPARAAPATATAQTELEELRAWYRTINKDLEAEHAARRKSIEEQRKAGSLYIDVFAQRYTGDSLDELRLPAPSRVPFAAGQAQARARTRQAQFEVDDQEHYEELVELRKEEAKRIAYLSDGLMNLNRVAIESGPIFEGIITGLTALQSQAPVTAFFSLARTLGEIFKGFASGQQAAISYVDALRSVEDQTLATAEALELAAAGLADIPRSRLEAISEAFDMFSSFMALFGQAGQYANPFGSPGAFPEAMAGRLQGRTQAEFLFAQDPSFNRAMEALFNPASLFSEPTIQNAIIDALAQISSYTAQQITAAVATLQRDVVEGRGIPVGADLGPLGDLADRIRGTLGGGFNRTFQGATEQFRFSQRLEGVRPSGQSREQLLSAAFGDIVQAFDFKNLTFVLQEGVDLSARQERTLRELLIENMEFHQDFMAAFEDPARRAIRQDFDAQEMAFRRTAQARLKQAGADPFEQAEVLRSLRVIINGMRISEEGRYAALTGGAAVGSAAGPGAAGAASGTFTLNQPSEPITVDLAEHTELLAYSAQAWEEILDISTLGSFFVDLSGGITIRPYVVEDWSELISFGSQAEITPEDVLAKPDHAYFERWIDIEILKAIEGPDADLIHSAVTDAIDNTVPGQLLPEILLEVPEGVKFTDWYDANLLPGLVTSGLSVTLRGAFTGPESAFQKMTLWPETLLKPPDPTSFETWYSAYMPSATILSGLDTAIYAAIDSFGGAQLTAEGLLKEPSTADFEMWYTDYLQGNVGSGLLVAIGRGLAIDRVQLEPEHFLLAPGAPAFDEWYQSNLKPVVDSGLVSAIREGTSPNYVLQPWRLLDPPTDTAMESWYRYSLYPRLVDNLDIKTAFRDRIVTLEPADMIELSPDFSEVVMKLVIEGIADRSSGTASSGPVPIEPTDRFPSGLHFGPGSGRSGF